MDHSKCPKIFIEGLPDLEQEPATTLNRQLFKLGPIVDRLRPALLLSDFCELWVEGRQVHRDNKRSVNPDPEVELSSSTEFFADSKSFVEWMSIADRDVAHTIGDFAGLLRKICETIKTIPTVLAKLEGDDIDRLFERIHNSLPAAHLSQGTVDALENVLLKFYDSLRPAETETNRLWNVWRDRPA
ncbi:hypothetical protein EOC93_22265 [Mesorhizobium sp. M6A.T.Ce.TU.002.03.1.1]|uniref:hypothetical protein n=1 Tax=Mesorhizobium sp. M6A.T.Ce.TU.002.03.1.1 TaxID=2496782 RepID=UPI000FCA2BB8|nr:hypothetical protein [Mesorhizobium sp. M6A.T.Ce.TU.002.03.1.1]RUU39355.1 hypothetical protein EOC93_22265 [Mesorhizobium sp. M6A.T.Ce.TU.002.03.1.1]